MAVLTWLSAAYAGLLLAGLLGLVATMLRLMWLVHGVLRDVDRTRRSIAAHTAPLGGQLAAVGDAAAATSEHLLSAVAAMRRARTAIEKAG
jgi:hypothetical protein